MLGQYLHSFGGSVLEQGLTRKSRKQRRFLKMLLSYESQLAGEQHRVERRLPGFLLAGLARIMTRTIRHIFDTSLN